VSISAFLCKDKANVFVPGNHGGTYCGNPLVCATGYEVVKYIIENDICSHVRKVGAHLVQSLKELQEKHPVIADVRGKGLLLAIQFEKDISGNVLTACLEEGMLVNAVKPNAIRFMPPLIITNQEADTAVAILDKAIARVS
jgi:acetylornithine/succinyldiaminopimelate/putrescine aminotransferase